MSLLIVGGGGTRWCVRNPPNQIFLGVCEVEAVGRTEMRTCSDRGRTNFPLVTLLKSSVCCRNHSKKMTESERSLQGMS